jgi:hypothetical protein
MINLGLAGAAGSGKDTVADYLVETYGFVKYSFSDALYDEIQKAYSLSDQSLLRDRHTKDVPTERLSLLNCKSDEFIGTAVYLVPHESHHLHLMPLSPRQVLQWWGTQFRRAQDPDYWLRRAEGYMGRVWSYAAFPEQSQQLFVNTSVRFPNEQAWIHGFPCGNVWHIRRDGLAPVHAHESEVPLPVAAPERVLWNNDTVERLHYGIDLLLRSNAEFVKVEPMAERTV